MGDALDAILSGPSYETLRAVNALEHMHAFEVRHLAILTERDRLMALATVASEAISFHVHDPDVPFEAIASARERLFAIGARLNEIAAEINPAFDAWMTQFDMEEAP